MKKFTPVLYNELQLHNLEQSCLFNQVTFFQEEIHDLEDYDLAIVGLCSNALNKFRESFYSFGNHFQLPILDLGLINWTDSKELQDHLSEISNKVQLIVIGGNQAWRDGNIAYLSNKSKQSTTCTLKNIGFQRHRIGQDDFFAMEEFQNLSLGELRKNIRGVEPLLRSCQSAIINLDVIKSADSMLYQSNLCGLTIEEVCQITRYMGLCSDIKGIQFPNLSNYKSHINSDSIYECIATMCWYYLEGILNTRFEEPTTSSDNVNFVIQSDFFKDPLEFVKSNLSGRWWVKMDDGEYIPCGYEDYVTCKNGDVPERLMQFMV